MFSRVVSAARGLLAGEPNASQQDQTSSSAPAGEQADSDATTTMVTATRRSRFADADADPEADSATSTPRTGSPAVNGKRKSTSSTPDVADTQTAKRRKKPAVNGDARINEESSSSAAAAAAPESESLDTRRFRTLQSVEIASRRSSDQHASQDQDQDVVQQSLSSIQKNISGNITDSKSTTGATHVRFGSEDPGQYTREKEDDTEKHTITATPSGRDGIVSESGSDDNEAPEAVSNITQLNELREAERRRADARKKRDQTSKAKRKEHESLLKFQAASKPRHAPSSSATVSDRPLPGHEEIRSESSATLQGSDVRATEWPVKQPLPTFLPDEILNAEPTPRPPTPPRDTEKSTMKTSSSSSKKLRFLDAEHKPPKDVMVGGTSVRVLNGTTHYNSKTGSNQSLPPKLSKSSRKVRDSWVSGNRNKDVSSGLRRTAGGSSAFVRR